MRNFYRGGKLTVTHSNPKTVPWRNQVATIARNVMYGSRKLVGPLEMCIDFYLKRGKTVSRLRPSCKPDLDKLVRAIGDALEGVVYTNDSQVVRIIAQKHYGSDPRAEVIIREIP
jgi:Holliday junction resolvase RusA-like endonuclease